MGKKIYGRKLAFRLNGENRENEDHQYPRHVEWNREKEDHHSEPCDGRKAIREVYVFR